ncbi:MAG: hypothetical protein NXI35_15590 [bacterium]|nr:hypothetical protein [bacterium]
MTIAEQLLAEGMAKGMAKGVAQGKAQGVVEGELRRAGASILTVLEARGLSVPAEVRARVEGCQDLGVLQHWLTRAVAVASADQIFEG